MDQQSTDVNTAPTTESSTSSSRAKEIFFDCLSGAAILLASGVFLWLVIVGLFILRIVFIWATGLEYIGPVYIGINFAGKGTPSDVADAVQLMIAGGLTLWLYGFLAFSRVRKNWNDRSIPRIDIWLRLVWICVIPLLLASPILAMAILP